MSIQEKVKTLLELRDEVNLKKELLDEAKFRKDQMDREIMEELRSLGFNSIKTDQASVAIAHRKSMKIVDEKAVIAMLKTRGLAKEYVDTVEKLNQYAPKAIEILAQDNEIDGVEMVDTEYISIRNNNKDKEQGE